MKIKGEIEFSIVEKNPEYVISKMPVQNGMLNPFGTVHAGAILWLADVTATVLASIKQDKGFPVAVNLFTNLLGNQRDGEIVAEARITRSGKRITVIRTLVKGNNDKLLAEVLTTHIQSIPQP